MGEKIKRILLKVKPLTKRKVALTSLILTDFILIVFLVWANIYLSSLNLQSPNLVIPLEEETTSESLEGEVLGEKGLAQPPPSPTPSPSPNPSPTPMPTPNLSSSPSSSLSPSVNPNPTPPPSPTSSPEPPIIVILRIERAGIPEEEYIEIENQGGSSQQLLGWELYNDCQGGEDKLVFTITNHSLPDGRTVKLYTGDGENDEETIYMKKDAPVWSYCQDSPEDCIASLKDQNGSLITIPNCN